jgi:UDP-N-acetyl-D-glucosamine dehydrogenase
VPLSPRALASYDVVLLATNHDAFDYQQIREHSRLIVDTRGVYEQPAQDVVKA